ncbi:hypothetical protein QBC41DRAFT_303452 [Cercophora samala]|uniref:Uncharacterized protein n=1 Tax=Cercophora samala TaxID=330535 RepID=A0AA39ZD90_9PEZI|nr:hypothetical protein QBC41DRAFT_303452 [Cercophora samala]
MHRLRSLPLIGTILTLCSTSETSPFGEPLRRATTPLPAKPHPHICGISFNSTKNHPFTSVHAGFDIPTLSLRDDTENQTFRYLQYPILSQGVALGGTDDDDDDDDDCETHLRAQLRTQLVHDITNTSAPPLVIHSLHLAILPFPWVKIPAGLPDGGLNDTTSLVINMTITSPKSASMFVPPLVPFLGLSITPPLTIPLHSRNRTFFLPPQQSSNSSSSSSSPGHHPQHELLLANYTVTLIPNGRQTWANISLENHAGLPDNMYKTPESYTFHDLGPRSTLDTRFCAGRAWWMVSEATADRYRRPGEQTGEREYFPRFGATGFWDMAAGEGGEGGGRLVSPVGEGGLLGEGVDRWEMVQVEREGGRRLCWFVGGGGEGEGEGGRLVSSDSGEL